MVAFMGGIGGWELLLVAAAVLLVFGPDRLPEIMRKIASITMKVRTANRDFQREMYRNLDPDEIRKDSPSAEHGRDASGQAPAPKGRKVEIEETGHDDA